MTYPTGPDRTWYSQDCLFAWASFRGAVQQKACSINRNGNYLCWCKSPLSRVCIPQDNTSFVRLSVSPLTSLATIMGSTPIKAVATTMNFFLSLGEISGFSSLSAFSSVWCRLAPRFRPSGGCVITVLRYFLKTLSLLWQVLISIGRLMEWKYPLIKPLKFRNFKNSNRHLVSKECDPIWLSLEIILIFKMI